jgi:hypothetical protein
VSAAPVSVALSETLRFTAYLLGVASCRCLYSSKNQFRRITEAQSARE